MTGQQLPVAKFRAGQISSAVWRNEIQVKGKAITVLKVTVQRRYKDKEGNWQSSGSFSRNEIPLQVGAKIFGIVGRDGGYTAKVADVCIVVPTISSDTVTAHAESFQAVLWHLIVSHPEMKIAEMKWESVK